MRAPFFLIMMYILMRAPSEPRKSLKLLLDGLLALLQFIQSGITLSSGGSDAVADHRLRGSPRTVRGIEAKLSDRTD